MKLGLLSLPAALLLAIAAFAIGCSDSSETLTLDEYFAEFAAIDADVDSQIDALFADFPEGNSEEDFFADDTNLPFFKDIVAESSGIVRDAIDRMKALDPPAEVEDAHNDLIDAGEMFVIAFEEGNDVILDAETMAEFEALNNEVEPTIAIAETAFDNACLALVAVGEANGITVNVTCEDDD